jgi:hypothetical protein
MGGGKLAGFLAGMSTSAAAIGHVAFAHGLGEAFTLSTVLSLIAAALSALRGKAAPTAAA